MPSNWVQILATSVANELVLELKMGLSFALIPGVRTLFRYRTGAYLRVRFPALEWALPTRRRLESR
jgi:hypothetical protein